MISEASDPADFPPLSALNDLLFCARRCALHRIEQVWVENAYTLEGTHGHRRAHAEMEDEEDGVRRVRGLWLRSARLGLVGKADVVEFRPIAPSPPTPLPRGGEGGSTSDGSPLTPLPRKAEGGSTSAPHPLPLSSEGARGETNEIPFPVEYKRGRKRRWDNDEVQLCAQAMCLEEMLGVQVPAGAIFHVKTRRRREVSFTPALRAQTEDAARRLHELLASGRTPLPVFKPRCKGCSVRDLCFPQTLDNPARVRDYCRQLWVTGPG